MKKAAFLLTSLMILVCLLSGCDNSSHIPDSSLPSDTSASASTEPSEASQSQHSGELYPGVSEGSIPSSLYGSYLTMYSGEDELEFPYIRLFDSYEDIEDYFYPSERYFRFGKRFTMACASFNDEFFAENDVMMLVIKEDSTYVSHSLDNISEADGKTNIAITRHIDSDATESNSEAVYHLILTAPKGAFSEISADNFSLTINEVQDAENSQALDAERFRYVYPEFWPQVYSSDATSDDSVPVIDSIQSYDELLGFYDSYKDDFDLDNQFLRYIGPVYDEAMFDDYILLIAVLPYDDRLPRPVVSELFVYNNQIYISIDNLTYDVPPEEEMWYLTAVAVSKRDLDGVNLKEFNIG